MLKQKKTISGLISLEGGGVFTENIYFIFLLIRICFLNCYITNISINMEKMGCIDVIAHQTWLKQTWC